MNKRILALLLVLSLIVPLLPVFLNPSPVAASYYTFHQIDPPQLVTISSDDTWVTINASDYGVPVGATGIFFIYKNYEGSGGYDIDFGIRKYGSVDNRINPMWEHTPGWGAIGVNEDCLFQVYKGSQSVKFQLYIMGYTTSGVTFFANGIDKTPTTKNSWRDIDCSAEAPNAIGLIFEVVGPSRGESMTMFGFRKNGSSDTFVYNAADHLAQAIMIGCDSNQVCEGYAGYNYEFYLIGYVTDGAYFYTNGVYQGPAITGSWQDLPTALPANSVMGFYEYRGSGSAYANDLRKNGSSWAFGGLDARHCWAWAGCDGSGLVEGQVNGPGVAYYLVGYATPGFYSVTTQDATDVDAYSATLNGNIVDTDGEDVEQRGFQWGLTENATWEWYETGSAWDYTPYGSDNYLDNIYNRRGQHVTWNLTLLSLKHYLCKIANPTGNVTFAVRAADDTVLWSEVLCDASELTGAFAWYEIELDEPLVIDEEVRVTVEFDNGDATNKVDTAHTSSDQMDGQACKYNGSSWSDDGSSRDFTFYWKYQASGHYSTGAYEHEVTGLDDDETYYYRAYTVTNVTSHYGLWVPFTTSNLPVMQTNAASSVAMTTARLNSVILSDGDAPVTVTFGWGNSSQTEVEDYDNYQVLPGTYTEGEHPYLDIDGLDPSTTYHFKVKGENVNGYGLGDDETFTTDDLTGNVENFKGVPSSDSISLSWDLLEGASTYLIKYKFGSFPTGTTDGTTAYSGSSTSTIHESLAAGTTYYYAIWGESGGVYSPNSTTLMLTTSAYIDPGDTLTPPSEPTNWMAAPDYTRMEGLGYFYDGVNGTADTLGMPRATLWFILYFGMALFLTLLFYLKIRQSKGAGTLTLVVLTLLLWVGLIIRLLPFWIPLLSTIAVIGLAISHREVAQG